MHSRVDPTLDGAFSEALKDRDGKDRSWLDRLLFAPLISEEEGAADSGEDRLF